MDRQIENPNPIIMYGELHEGSGFPDWIGEGSDKRSDCCCSDFRLVPNTKITAIRRSRITCAAIHVGPRLDFGSGSWIFNSNSFGYMAGVCVCMSVRMLPRMFFSLPLSRLCVRTSLCVSSASENDIAVTKTQTGATHGFPSIPILCGHPLAA